MTGFPCFLVHLVQSSKRIEKTLSDYVHTMPTWFENGAKNITFHRCGHTVPQQN